MSLKYLCMVSALLGLLCSRAVRAEEITFTFTLNDGMYLPITATFPDSFSLSFDGSSGSTESVTQYIGSETKEAEVLFTGFDFILNNYATRITASSEIFDSSTAAFIDGTFADSELFNNYPEAQTGLPEGSHLEGTLVITQSAGPSGITPEPSSVALLGTGLLGFAGVVKRRWIAAV